MEYIEAQDKEKVKLDKEVRMIIKNSLSSLLNYHHDRILPT